MSTYLLQPCRVVFIIEYGYKVGILQNSSILVESEDIKYDDIILRRRSGAQLVIEAHAIAI